ncbi:MAG: HNH endonuclease signature motif containing protein [Desulfatiglandaceae bacterium]
MSSYISEHLRQAVALRADHLCEYCLIHEEDTFFGCEVDHIISLKHGGVTESDNLAYACFFCNRRKGSDIGSVSNDGAFVRFFNPRHDRWVDHFRIEGLLITPISEIGDATARILHFNADDRLLERRILTAARKFPSSSALVYMSK